MYKHGAYLDEVASEDRDHVGRMLTRLDEYCQGTGILGDFLSAIIVGDLHRAVGHADGTNVKYLALYSKYCYNQLPLLSQDLARPLFRALYATRDVYEWPTRDQVRKAARRLRGALKHIMLDDHEET